MTKREKNYDWQDVPGTPYRIKVMDPKETNWADMADRLLASRQYEGAQVALLSAIKRKPKDPELWSKLVISFRMRGLNSYAEAAEKGRERAASGEGIDKKIWEIIQHTR